MDYKNKIILITGAAQGLGKAVSVEFAKAGAIVILADLNNAPQLATVESLRAQKLSAHAYECNVSSDVSVATLRDAVLRDVGTPDIIYNNAMLSRSGGILNLEIESVRAQMDVNVLGYLRIVRAFLPQMVERKSGWIVNTASPNGLAPPPMVADHLLAYCISKAADISMSQCMAISLKPHGIGVCVVYPDVTYTESVDTLNGSAPSEFHDGFRLFFSKASKSAEEVGKRIVEELRKGQFFTNTMPGFEAGLIDIAKRGMELNPEYFSSTML